MFWDVTIFTWYSYFKYHYYYYYYQIKYSWFNILLPNSVLDVNLKYAEYNEDKEESI